jgi:hypothetical protein
MYKAHTQTRKYIYFLTHMYTVTDAWVSVLFFFYRRIPLTLRNKSKPQAEP